MKYIPPVPDIDCVLIGINCSGTLGRCIESVRNARYPQEKLHLCYVDGGSTDGSIGIAEQYEGVEVLSITPQHPTPGIGRNTGWKAGSSPLVQFLDSDTVIDPEWFGKAVEAIRRKKVGAVLGTRREMHPERSIYNWLGNLEWNGPAGESACFGGDVLIRRGALEATGGYDEELVGGEDPELSRRIVRAGWTILRLDDPMTGHDLAMTKIHQYVRRAFRSGYGFGAVRHREAALGSTFWLAEYRKITIKGGGFALALLLALPLLSAASTPAVLAAGIVLLCGTTLLLMPRLFKVGKFMREQRLRRSEARTYAWHCSLVVLPQLAGVIRFHAGRLTGRPLRNRPSRLATGNSGEAA